MKKFSCYLLTGLLLCGLTIDSFAKELKVGCVDAIEVFNEYQKTKDYDKILEQKKSDKEKKLEDKGAELEKLQNKLSVLKKEEQIKEKANLDKLIKEFKDLRTQSFADLKKDRDQKMQEIIEDINKVIKDYSAKNNYDLMLYKSAIIFSDKAMDVTAEILKLVNEKYKKK